MTRPSDPGDDAPPSAGRARLCSREHAHQVAARLFEARCRPVKVVRTGEQMQPFRVAPLDEPVAGEVEVEVRAT